MLQAGAEVNVATDQEWTSLHLAAKEQNTFVMGLLLANSADGSLTDCYGATPLHYAVQLADFKHFDTLHRHPQCVVKAPDSRGRAASPGQDMLHVLLPLPASQQRYTIMHVVASLGPYMYAVHSHLSYACLLLLCSTRLLQLPFVSSRFACLLGRLRSRVVLPSHVRVERCMTYALWLCRVHSAAPCCCWWQPGDCKYSATHRAQPARWRQQPQENQPAACCRQTRPGCPTSSSHAGRLQSTGCHA